MEGASQSETRTTNDSVSVGARKAVRFELFAYESTVTLPFSASVVVDGDVISNTAGVTKASQLLSADQRRLPFSGSLRMSGVSDGFVRTVNLGGAAGCEGIEDSAVPIVAETGSTRLPANGLSADVKAELKRPRQSTPSNVWVAAPLAPLTADGPTIGPPDGTSYRVLYTTQVFLPTAQCGFNDLGVMIQGVFLREAREYQTYLNGQLVSQHQTFVDTFQNCWSP